MINDNYMTKKEMCDFLQITDNYKEATYPAIIAKVTKIFGFTTCKKSITEGSRPVTVYKRNEVTKIAEDVIEFFDKHYTKRVTEEKIGTRVFANKFEAIPIPDGYTLIMKTHTGCDVDKVAHRKNEVDEYCDIKLNIEQGHYISRKNTMSYLGISEKPFNRIKNEFEEIKFNKVYYYKFEKVQKYKEKKIEEEEKKIEKLSKDIVKDTTIRKSEYIPEGFVDKKIVAKRFKMSKCSEYTLKYRLAQLTKEFSIDVVRVGSKLYYKESDISRSITEVEDFFENHYTKDEFENLKSTSIVKTLNPDRVGIPSHYKILGENLYPDKNINSVAFKKTTVETLNIDEYIKLEDVMQLLNQTRTQFNKTRAEYELRSIKYMNVLYFERSKILELREKCIKFYEEYITKKQAMDIYFGGYDNIMRKYSEYLKEYDVPMFAHIKDNVSSLAQTKGKVLKISEVEYLKNNLEDIRREELRKKEIAGISTRSRKSYINYDIKGETHLETFYLRLYERWEGFSNESRYTKTKWLKFIEDKIDTMRADEVVSNNKINSYISCTREMDNMLKYFSVNEVYELSSNDINTYFNIMDTKKQREVFYDFLTLVSNDVEYVSKRKGVGKKGFRMENIISPYDENRDTRKSHSYGFDIYSKMFRYAVNLDLHIEKSITEITEKNTATYASTWLYCILHLNNAWRHGDVTRFPRLELQEVLAQNKIQDFEWFKENKISLPTSRLIITKVLQWEMVISKTEAKGSFFCSDELAPAFASSILILSLYHEKIGHISSLGQESNMPIMEFTTKYNRPSEKNINDYFKDFDVEGFKFSSLRMNKTIMTLLYSLAVLSGDSKALVYAQKLRGHIDESSSLEYIEIDMDNLDLLARHLFARGEFGYITSLLVSRLTNNEDGPVTFEDMTKQIVQANTLFGEFCGLYSTVGFLNSVSQQRQLVIDTLAEKSLEDCQKILTDIYTEKMPSRMKYVQCLISNEGCYKTASDEEEISCFDCPYHIPSIYALTTLCEGIMSDMEKYKTATRVKQFKLSLSIDRKTTLLKEAIVKYGHEYVYNCIGIDRESFGAILDTIPTPDEFDDLIVLEG